MATTLIQSVTPSSDKCKGRYYFGCTASFIALQFCAIPQALLSGKEQTE
jgi:hypothetical protein